MKVIFFGTPALCVPYLDMLHTQHELLAVVCNPDQPVGRKQIMTAPPTAVWAQEHSVPALQPSSLRKQAPDSTGTDFREQLQKYPADIYIVVAYGKIIPDDIIKQPYHGTLNVHYSLLPRHRGASPVEAAILAGDTTGGVCIQQMRYELDSGPIWAQESLAIGPNDFARELRDGVMGDIGIRLLSQVLDIRSNIHTMAPRDIPSPTEQAGEPTYCYRIKKSDGELLPSDTDEMRWRKYRAYYPWPGVFYWDESGKRIKITQATYVDGRFVIQKYIREGESEIQLF